MKYFSMFSGIGGFELGIEKATKGKWECIGYSEIDKYAIQTYESHFKHKNYGNARDIDPGQLPDFEMLCGGFPCQSFSIAGKRKGFQDTRGTLFHEILRIAQTKRPRLLFLENVKGLLSADDGRCFATIITKLDELGYNVEWQVLNSKNFGVPQNRERVFIIGHLRGESGQQVFPIGCCSKEDNEESELHDYTRTITTAHAHGTAKHMSYIKVHNMMPRSGNPKQGGTGHLTKDDGTTYCLDSGNTNAIEVVGTLDSEGWEKRHENIRRVYGINGVSPTIPTGTGGGVMTKIMKNKSIRRLTPTECERLQGFPDNWTIGSDTQRYKQCGNAVTVNVIQAIMECSLTKGKGNNGNNN